MSEIYNKFVKDAEKRAFDIEHRSKINFNISKYDTAVVKGKKQYKDIELAKTRASFIKKRVVDDLEKNLIEFSANFEKRGGKVIWARNSKEAINAILRILKKNEAKHVVKSKSMTTEEIHLNEALERNKIESLETDLGEYIVQVAGEPPYHIVTPAT